MPPRSKKNNDPVKGSELETSSLPLRRSSRSTRASVKPVIDLSKQDSTDGDESNDIKVKKSKVGKKPSETDLRDDKVTISESSESAENSPSELDEDYDDDGNKDFEEEIPKSRKGSRGANSKSNPKSKQKSENLKTKRDCSANVTKPLSKAAKSRSSNSEPKNNSKTDQTPADEFEVLHELSEKEMIDVNNAFDMNISSAGEEVLSRDDLKTAIRSLGFEPRADEIKRLVKRFSNKDNMINRDGFHKIMAFKMGSVPGTERTSLNDEISRVFNLLDLDKTGMITVDNLRSISTDLNEQITDEELKEMISEADIDGDFMINRLEFYNIMKKTGLY